MRWFQKLREKMLSRSIQFVPKAKMEKLLEAEFEEFDEEGPEAARAGHKVESGITFHLPGRNSDMLDMESLVIQKGAAGLTGSRKPFPAFPSGCQKTIKIIFPRDGACLIAEAFTFHP